MKNPNSPLNRSKEWFAKRWRSEDYPGGEPRFQMGLLAKDIGAFVVPPIASILIWQSCVNGFASPKRSSARQESREAAKLDVSQSQILDFGGAHFAGNAISARKRAPGVLVKVRLLNVVETYSTTPVHAQIIDAGLGQNLVGGVLIGDGTPDTNFQRINITFRFARDPGRDSVAYPVAARALGLDGTLGLMAQRKEGFFARSALGGANTGAQDAKGALDSMDLKSIVLKALSAGLLQELGNGAQVENNRAHVLRLAPSTEFFAELTDYFPSSGK